SASAASTCGGTGVGPGVNRYFFPAISPRLAMRAEDHDLLEGRTVCPAHRVRDEAREPDALLRRVGMPRRRSSALRRLQLVPGLVERLPERGRTECGNTAAAVDRRKAGVQILLDVAVPT